MLTLSWIFNLNNYISYFFIRPPPFLMLTLLLSHFKGDLSWTNIWILQGNDFPSRSYWPYLKKLLHLHPGLSALSDWHPSQITWRCFMGRAAWLHPLASEIKNPLWPHCQLCHLTTALFYLYVLHKQWDDTQLPMRKFDEYLPYVPSRQETWQFISTMPDLKQKTMVTVMYS